MIYVYNSFYLPKSYGISCMYNLIRILNRNGISAKALCYEDERYDYEIPEDIKPYYISKAALPKKIEDKDIVIYSDVISDNPLGAKRVIRWLMNKPCFLTGKKINYGPKDVLVAYSKLVSERTY